MKVATFQIGGERRVGIVDPTRGTVAPFDLPMHEAAAGVLALVRDPKRAAVDRGSGGARFRKWW